VEEKSRVLIIREDTFLKGEIRNAGRLEVFGYVEGDIVADSLIVQPGGRCYGRIKAGTAEVRGDLQGDIFVREVMSIRSTGEVAGNIKYGKLGMEMGGTLSAELRNIPPSISGDLDLSVDRGQATRITLQDLSALDPDDSADHLVFSVSEVTNGFVVLASDPAQPVANFTQADLERGAVMFRHDGTEGQRASFAVVVADHAGATSGAAQTVNVAVRH